jgi:hypothetical protein
VPLLSGCTGDQTRERDANDLPSAAELEKPPELSHDLLRTVPVTSTVVSADEVMGEPIHIGAIHDDLLVTDLAGQPFLHLFRKATGKRITSFGRRGQGPGEFVSGPSFVSTAQGAADGSPWLHDTWSNKLTRFAGIRGADADNLPREAGVFEIPTRRVRGLVQVQRGWFLASMVETDNAHPDGFLAWKVLGEGIPLIQERRVFGMDINGKGTVPLARAFAHTLCVRPDGERLAVAYITAGRLDVVDVKTLTHTIANVPLPFAPALARHPQTGRVDFLGDNPNVRAGYIDCATTKSANENKSPLRCSGKRLSASIGARRVATAV